MSPSNNERQELEQDIDGLRSSITALESSRSRLQDLVSSSSGTAASSDSFWGDLAEVVGDFFEMAEEGSGREKEEDADEGEDEGGGETGAAFKQPRRGVSTGALGAAFDKLRHRVAEDLNLETPTSAPMPELHGVMDELDAQLATLNAELQTKLDQFNAIPVWDEDTTTVTPGPPVPDHTVVQPDTDVIPDPTDVVIPDVDVLPNVDPVLPVVDVDVTPTADVLPDVDPIPPVVDVDVIPAVTPADDDTPAYDPGQQTEIGELDGAVYDVNEILASGKTVADLRRYDVPAGVVRDAGVSASAMIAGGYTLSDMHEAGYSVSDLHGLASAADMHDAGYSASDLHGTFSLSDCIQAFSAHELRDAGFGISEFHGVVSLSSLRDVFSVGELRTMYSASDLRDAGFHAGELSAAGLSWEELASAGFTLSELQAAGATDSVLKGIFPSDFSTSTDDDDSAQYHSS